MRWILGILINAILFIALSGYFQGFYVESVGSAIMASLILSILNILVRPILILLTLPITILSLGIFLLVINAITLVMTDELMGPSFEIDSFGMAFLVAVIMAVVNLILQETVFRKQSG
ncbi:putative membrane protein YvlD [Weizmannia acidilactici]|uniref:Membrane protein YvlD n=1 Tax=Weizmannia acidilactici TaxID=2607726 RepID=A0A5J4JH75_9BACI|nr:phage holin family protein [Weizmannia acidilactici]GER65953.1 putative membrane protein YvlD [Weizmannia acidilactici]GER69718.1 putative membrane protein YvlD [Weizmannia acidilactici]GER74409.1 putative membrane protein YvlD [Weizmannia acidilactici]